MFRRTARTAGQERTAAGAVVVVTSGEFPNRQQFIPPTYDALNDTQVSPYSSQSQAAPARVFLKNHDRRRAERTTDSTAFYSSHTNAGAALDVAALGKCSSGSLSYSLVN